MRIYYTEGERERDRVPAISSVGEAREREKVCSCNGGDGQVCM